MSPESIGIKLLDPINTMSATVSTVLSQPLGSEITNLKAYYFP